MQPPGDRHQSQHQKSYSLRLQEKSVLASSFLSFFFFSCHTLNLSWRNTAVCKVHKAMTHGCNIRAGVFHLRGKIAHVRLHLFSGHLWAAMRTLTALRPSIYHVVTFSFMAWWPPGATGRVTNVVSSFTTSSSSFTLISIQYYLNPESTDFYHRSEL